MPTRSRTDQIDALYRAHAARLQRQVHANVQADPETVADACSFAWTQLLIHTHVRTDPSDPPIGWLHTVATRQVWHLTRREQALTTRDARDSIQQPAFDEDLLDQLHLHERATTALARLTERQRRYLLLHAAGYRYSDIAQIEQTTVRTVDRQLRRAHDRLRGR